MQAACDLGDFAEFLRDLDRAGHEFTVIGGCAVGAYARLRGERVLSKDLDVYVSPATLGEMLAQAPAHGARVVKVAQPRALPVAVLDWQGKTIAALTRVLRLPEPEPAARSAREFTLSTHDGLSVPVVDPFDLLASKLAVGREQDRAHAAILVGFLTEEVVADFGSAERPRRRIRAARRLFDSLGVSTLDDSLTDRLIPLATDPTTRRFLVHHAARREQAWQVIAASPGEEQHALEELLAQRRAEP